MKRTFMQADPPGGYSFVAAPLLIESLNDFLVLGAKIAGKTITVTLQILADPIEFGSPLLSIDVQKLRELFIGDIEAGHSSRPSQPPASELFASSRARIHARSSRRSGRATRARSRVAESMRVSRTPASRPSSRPA